MCCKFFNQSPTHFKDDFLGGENIVWQLSCTCIYIGYTTGPWSEIYCSYYTEYLVVTIFADSRNLGLVITF